MGIELKNIHYAIEHRLIYDCVNFKISKPGLYCLVGENGKGKTTLFDIICQERKNVTGQIFINEELVFENGKVYKDIPSYMTYIKFEETLFEKLTMKEHFDLLGINVDSIEQELEVFNLKPLLALKVKRMSKGERTRLYLLLGILTSKDILLLDEVTANLDFDTEKTIFDYLKVCSKEKIIIYASNTNECMQYAETIIKVDQKMDVNYSLDDGFPLNRKKAVSLKKTKLFYFHKRVFLLLLSTIFLVFFLLSFFFLNVYSVENMYKSMLNEADGEIMELNYSNYYFSNNLDPVEKDKYSSPNSSGFVVDDTLPWALDKLSSLAEIPFKDTTSIISKFDNQEVKDGDILLSKDLAEVLNIHEESNHMNVEIYKKNATFTLDSGYTLNGLFVFGSMASGVAMNYNTYVKFLQEYLTYDNSRSLGITAKYKNIDCTYNETIHMGGNTVVATVAYDVYISDLENYDIVLPTIFETQYPDGITVGQNDMPFCNSSNLRVKYEDIKYVGISKEIFKKGLEEHGYMCINRGVKISVLVKEQYRDEIIDFLSTNSLFLSVENQKGYSTVYSNAKENQPIYISLVTLSCLAFFAILLIDCLYFIHANKKSIIELERYAVKRKSIVSLLSIKNAILYIVFLLVGFFTFNYIVDYISDNKVLNQNKLVINVPSIKPIVYVTFISAFIVFILLNSVLLIRKQSTEKR